MPASIRGSFAVQRTPFNPAEATSWAGFAGFALDKHYQGELEATAQGVMLAAGTEVQGSAGYIALERVTGMLAGRQGTFVLQHHGLMARGVPELRISVVPDSATGALKGLTGTMGIEILDGGRHFYTFDYDLPLS